jgi:hypothetical protein
MYATMQTASPADLQSQVDALAREPGCVAAYGWRPLGSACSTLIALWDAEPSGDGASIDLIYEVCAADRSLPRRAGAATDGPRGPASAMHVLGLLH